MQRCVTTTASSWWHTWLNLPSIATAQRLPNTGIHNPLRPHVRMRACLSICCSAIGSTNRKDDSSRVQRYVPGPRAPQPRVRVSTSPSSARWTTPSQDPRQAPRDGTGWNFHEARLQQAPRWSCMPKPLAHYSSPSNKGTTQAPPARAPCATSQRSGGEGPPQPPRCSPSGDQWGSIPRSSLTSPSVTRERGHKLLKNIMYIKMTVNNNKYQNGKNM